MNYAIDVTVLHLGVEVLDISAFISNGGTELLKHGLEGIGFANHPVIAISIVLIQIRLLTCLSLTDDKELVVGTRAVKHGAAGLLLNTTDAQTVGQQLY